MKASKNANAFKLRIITYIHTIHYEEVKQQQK